MWAFCASWASGESDSRATNMSHKMLSLNSTLWRRASNVNTYQLDVPLGALSDSPWGFLRAQKSKGSIRQVSTIHVNKELNKLVKKNVPNMPAVTRRIRNFKTYRSGVLLDAQWGAQLGVLKRRAKEVWDDIPKQYIKDHKTNIQNDPKQNVSNQQNPLWT